MPGAAPALRQNTDCSHPPWPKQSAQSVADVLLFHPFTARRLLSYIDRLLQPYAEEMISYGPVAMNLDRRVLIMDGQETQLT